MAHLRTPRGMQRGARLRIEEPPRLHRPLSEVKAMGPDLSQFRTTFNSGRLLRECI